MVWNLFGRHRKLVLPVEPISVFSRFVDPAKVASRLQEVAANVDFDGSDDSWRKAVVTFGQGKSCRQLTLTHDPEYYSEPNWSKQMAGMRGYFSRFPECDSKLKAITLTTSLHFCLGTLFDPEFDPHGDPRLDVVFAIAEVLDGVLFTPSALRDASGRVLLGIDDDANGESEPVWPRVIGEVSIGQTKGADTDSDPPATATAEEPVSAEAPSAQRVARRALALTAVTARANLEQFPADEETLGYHSDVLAWINEIGIQEELEPDEWKVLQRQPGKLGPQDQINATWRVEGLVVLAWALGRFEIPVHDEVVQMMPLWNSLGFSDSEMALSLLDNAVLRPAEEIESLRTRLFALHWRLRNFHLNGKVLDFPDFARTCWFGPLDISGLPIVDGDLALQGQRIDLAPEDAFSAAHSAAQERHQAANWLREGPELYSHASTAT